MFVAVLRESCGKTDIPNKELSFMSFCFGSKTEELCKRKKI
jgi:hypothetical protein